MPLSNCSLASVRWRFYLGARELGQGRRGGSRHRGSQSCQLKSSCKSQCINFTNALQLLVAAREHGIYLNTATVEQPSLLPVGIKTSSLMRNSASVDVAQHEGRYDANAEAGARGLPGAAAANAPTPAAADALTGGAGASGTGSACGGRRRGVSNFGGDMDFAAQASQPSAEAWGRVGAKPPDTPPSPKRRRTGCSWEGQQQQLQPQQESELGVSRQLQHSPPSPVLARVLSSVLKSPPPSVAAAADADAPLCSSPGIAQPATTLHREPAALQPQPQPQLQPQWKSQPPLKPQPQPPLRPYIRSGFGLGERELGLMQDPKSTQKSDPAALTQLGGGVAAAAGDSPVARVSLTQPGTRKVPYALPVSVFVRRLLPSFVDADVSGDGGGGGAAATAGGAVVAASAAARPEICDLRDLSRKTQLELFSIPFVASNNGGAFGGSGESVVAAQPPPLVLAPLRRRCSGRTEPVEADGNGGGDSGTDAVGGHGSDKDTKLGGSRQEPPPQPAPAAAVTAAAPSPLSAPIFSPKLSCSPQSAASPTDAGPQAGRLRIRTFLSGGGGGLRYCLKRGADRELGKSQGADIGSKDREGGAHPLEFGPDGPPVRPCSPTLEEARLLLAAAQEGAARAAPSAAASTSSQTLMLRDHMESLGGGIGAGLEEEAGAAPAAAPVAATAATAAADARTGAGPVTETRTVGMEGCQPDGGAVAAAAGGNTIGVLVRGSGGLDAGADDSSHTNPAPFALPNASVLRRAGLAPPPPPDGSTSEAAVISGTAAAVRVAADAAFAVGGADAAPAGGINAESGGISCGEATVVGDQTLPGPIVIFIPGAANGSGVGGTGSRGSGGATFKVVLGLFDPPRYFWRRDCIRPSVAPNQWVSCGQFEKLSGASSSHWCRSIRVLGSADAIAAGVADPRACGQVAEGRSGQTSAPPLLAWQRQPYCAGAGDGGGSSAWGTESLGEWLDRHHLPIWNGPTRAASMAKPKASSTQAQARVSHLSRSGSGGKMAPRAGYGAAAAAAAAALIAADEASRAPAGSSVCASAAASAMAAAAAAAAAVAAATRAAEDCNLYVKAAAPPMQPPPPPLLTYGSGASALAAAMCVASLTSPTASAPADPAAQPPANGTGLPPNVGNGGCDAPVTQQQRRLSNRASEGGICSSSASCGGRGGGDAAAAVVLTVPVDDSIPILSPPPPPPPPMTATAAADQAPEARQRRNSRPLASGEAAAAAVDAAATAAATTATVDEAAFCVAAASGACSPHKDTPEPLERQTGDPADGAAGRAASGGAVRMPYGIPDTSNVYDAESRNRGEAGFAVADWPRTAPHPLPLPSRKLLHPSSYRPYSYEAATAAWQRQTSAARGSGYLMPPPPRGVIRPPGNGGAAAGGCSFDAATTPPYIHAVHAPALRPLLEPSKPTRAGAAAVPPLASPPTLHQPRLKALRAAGLVPLAHVAPSNPRVPLRESLPPQQVLLSPSAAAAPPPTSQAVRYAPPPAAAAVSAAATAAAATDQGCVGGPIRLHHVGRRYCIPYHPYAWRRPEDEQRQPQLASAPPMPRSQPTPPASRGTGAVQHAHSALQAPAPAAPSVAVIEPNAAAANAAAVAVQAPMSPPPRGATWVQTHGPRAPVVRAINVGRVTTGSAAGYMYVPCTPGLARVRQHVAPYSGLYMPYAVACFPHPESSPSPSHWRPADVAEARAGQEETLI